MVQAFIWLQPHVDSHLTSGPTTGTKVSEHNAIATATTFMRSMGDSGRERQQKNTLQASIRTLAEYVVEDPRSQKNRGT